MNIRRKKICQQKIVFLSVMLICPFIIPVTYAYETPTHREMSKKAYLRSVLSLEPSIFDDIGIDSQETFLNSEKEPRSIMDLVLDGSVLEDSNTPIGSGPSEYLRVKHHFYNAQKGGEALSWTVFGPNSPLLEFKTRPSASWALEDTVEIPFQDYSFNDANDSFFAAISEKSVDNRKKYWGHMFQSLGHVIHHIQDMAQPQHTRNDAHTPVSSVRNKTFEEYTERKRTDPNRGLPYGGYPQVNLETFNTARDFWDGVQLNDGIGLAEFSSTNFVSAGTNYEGGAISNESVVGANTPPDLPLPSGNNLPITVVDIPNTSIALPSGEFDGKVYFVGTQVTDKYIASESRFNSRTSAFSIFSSDLTGIGEPIYHLHRSNYDASHEYLVPRAVAYSAGLIDYFFRGRLEIELSDSGNEIEIKNTSLANFDFEAGGAFQVLYETNSEERKPIEGLANLELLNDLPNGNLHTITGLTSALQSVTDMGGEQKIIVVFDGNIGSERGLASSIWQPPELIPFLQTELIVDIYPRILPDGREDFVTREFKRTTSTFYLYKGAVFEHEIHDRYLRNHFNCTDEPGCVSRQVRRRSGYAEFPPNTDDMRLPASFNLSSLSARIAGRRIIRYDPKAPAAISVLAGLNLSGATAGKIDGSFGGEMAAPRLVSISLPPLEPINAAWLPYTFASLLFEPHPCVGTLVDCPAPDFDGYYAENPLFLHDGMGTTVFNAVNGSSYNSANCTLDREVLDVIQCGDPFVFIGLRDEILGLGGLWRISSLKGIIFVDPELSLAAPL